jgi:hypothetical protein
MVLKLRSWICAATLALVTLTTVAANDIFYPTNHFNYVTKIMDESSLNSFVQKNITEDKAVFVRWIVLEG